MTVIVVEHPNSIVIGHTLMWWIQVVEPVNEVVIDCLVTVDDMLIPSLLIVANWIWLRHWLRHWFWLDIPAMVLLVFFKQ